MTRCLNCDFDPDDDPYETEEPVTATDLAEYVMAAAYYRTNADLIVACHRLGYIKDTDLVLDPTYGNGGWWAKWAPTGVPMVIRAGVGVEFDFTDMPDDWSDQFDVVTFDPPYVSAGGRDTTTIPAFMRLYGMDDGAVTPAKIQGIINMGIDECTRVLKQGGFLLVKCMDYISSGKLWTGTFQTLYHALLIPYSLELQDIFYMVRHGTPQSQRNQLHARRNVSTLYVFRKP